jgi:hypothetical protein
MKKAALLLALLVGTGLLGWLACHSFWPGTVKTSFEDIKYAWMNDPEHGAGINLIFEGQSAPGNGALGLSEVAHNLCVAYAPVMAFPILKALKKHDPAFLATTIAYGQFNKVFHSTHFFLFEDGKTNCESELLPSLLRTDGETDVSL